MFVCALHLCTLHYENGTMPDCYECSVGSHAFLGDNTMAYQYIQYEPSDGIATLSLNRPEAMNALTTPMMDEMKAALKAADRDEAVRAVILTGAGKGFCSGADLTEIQQNPD